MVIFGFIPNARELHTCTPSFDIRGYLLVFTTRDMHCIRVMVDTVEKFWEALVPKASVSS